MRLLGPFDPWLQARDRTLIVPDVSRHKLLWPVLGRPGVVLVGTEVVALWRPRTVKSKVEITVEQFAPLPDRSALRLRRRRSGSLPSAVRNSPRSVEWVGRDALHARPRNGWMAG